jgi:hypothetical protein
MLSSYLMKGSGKAFCSGSDVVSLCELLNEGGFHAFAYVHTHTHAHMYSYCVCVSISRVLEPQGYVHGILNEPHTIIY